MNTQTKKLLIAAGVLLVALIVYLCSAHRGVRNLPVRPPNEAAASGAPGPRLTNAETSQTTAATVSQEPGTEKAPAAPGHQQQAVQDRAAEWNRALEDKNVQVDFWGRVVDQHETPVPGVRVVMRVRHWYFADTGGPASSFPRAEVLSDADGRFQWHGQTGDSLTIEAVERAGYKLSPRAPKAFSYGQSPEPFTPEQSRPVTIRMWRLAQSEPTVVNRGFFGFIPDGRFYTLDLVKNQKTEGDAPAGDIRIMISRSGAPQPREHYRWALEIAGVDGGVLEATDEFLFEAPEGGYQPSFKLEVDPASAEWTSVLRKQFYFRSRGGAVYGAINMTVRPDYAGESAIQVESVLNNHGSRNLQP